MSDLIRRARRRCPDSEAGFTLLELLITMALLGVVMAVVGAGMVSLTDTTRSTDERSRADTELRNAVETMARDVRAARPVDAQAPVAAYDTQIAFKTYCANPGGTCTSENLRQIVYRVCLPHSVDDITGCGGVASHRLEVSEGGGAFRPVLDVSQTSQFPAAARQFAIVNSASEPIFTYLYDDGTGIPTGAGTPGDPESPEKFRDCTQAVRIHLKMITEPGNTERPSDLTTTVTLRNFNEVSNCVEETTTTTA